MIGASLLVAQSFATLPRRASREEEAVSVFWEDHFRDMADPEYAARFWEALRLQGIQTPVFE